MAPTMISRLNVITAATGICRSSPNCFSQSTSNSPNSVVAKSYTLRAVAATMSFDGTSRPLILSQTTTTWQMLPATTPAQGTTGMVLIRPGTATGAGTANASSAAQTSWPALLKLRQNQ